MSDGRITFLIICAHLGVLLSFVVGKQLYWAVRGDIPEERIAVRWDWEAFEQRRYHPPMFTLRKTLALTTVVGLFLAAAIALVLVNHASIGRALDDPLSMIDWKFPGWWIGLAVAVLFGGPVAAFSILGGKRCPRCGGATEEDRSPSEIVLTCEACKIVYQTGWKEGGSDHGHDHPHF